MSSSQAMSHPSVAPSDGTAQSRDRDSRPQILVVCTANRCRSPIAAAMFERDLARRGVTARVMSAGLMHPGETVPPDGLTVARALGLDLSAHRSARLDLDVVRGSDLILGLTRGHAREVVAKVPERWPRTFTMRQFRRWIDHSGSPRHVALGEWLDFAAAERPRTDLIGRSREDDILDPMGRSIDVWHDVVSQMQAEVSGVVDGLATLLPRAR